MKSHSQKRKSSEMQIARGRLKGVLQDMVAGSDEDDDADSDLDILKKSLLPIRGRPPKKMTKDITVLPSQQQQEQQQQQHQQLQQPSQRETRSSTAASKISVQESFIMKLFDRSLDLSKYDEQTGLYPICRAWMANTPRSPSIKSYRSMNAILSSPVRRNVDAIDLLARLQSGEIMDITTLPAPDETNLPKICPVELITGSEIPLSNEMEDATHEELLSAHKMKWKAIRKNWQKHSKRYHQRYEKNYLIIKELFKP